jgi:hypothetical protein
MRYIHQCTVLFILLSPLLLPRHAAGQAMPMFNDPLKIRQVEMYAERLDFTTQQKEGVLQAYDQYVLAYERVRNGEIQKFEDLVTAFVDRFSFMNFEIPEREEIHEIISKGKRAMKSIERVDNTFFDNITGMLTEKQQRELKRIRNERHLDAYRIIVLEMLTDMNRSARPNLTQLVQFAVKAESPETTASLELYEQKMLRHAEDAIDVIITVIDLALDIVDEMGLRGMDREQMFMLVMEEEQIANLEAKGNILLAPLQKQAFKIGELNWKTWNTIDSQIAEEYKRPFAMAYFRKGFRNSVLGYEGLDRRFEKALDLELLEEEQQQELLALRQDYETRSLSLATKYSKILLNAWESRTIDQQQGGSSPEFDNSISQSETVRTKLLTTTRSRLDGILGSSLMSILDDQKKQTASKNTYYDTSTSTQSKVVEVQIENLDTPVKAILAGGVSIPRPMGSGFAKDIASQLGLGDEGEDIVNALFNDYRDKYNVYYESIQVESEAFNQDTSLGIGSRLRKKQELTDKASETVKTLDTEFFDDLSIVTGSDRSDPIVQMLEQFRMRKRISGTENRYGWGRTNGKALDLVDVFIIEDEPMAISEDSNKKLHQAMLVYHQQADSLFKEIEETTYQMNHLSDAMMLANEMNMSSSRAVNMESKWREAYVAIRLSRQNLIRSNQEVVSTLLSEMPEEDYWTVRMHYVKVAFPKIFKDTGNAKTILAAAGAIPTLDPAQQGEIARMGEQYRQQYWDLCESMIALNEAAVLQESDGRMITQASIKRRIDEEKLRFERSELNDRIRMRLRMTLNEDQIKNVPGLRPTVTARVEN